MAMNTYGVTLKWGESAENVAKVVDIKDFPDLMGAPETIETTTLSDAAQTHINGIRSSESMAFTCNYTKEDFTKVVGDAEKDLYYVLEFSDGSQFSWKGQHTCSITGKGVNEVIEYVINVSASTAVEFVTT